MKRGYMNGKGLSDVVTTIMIILLAIVVVGLLFMAVRNFATQGTAQIDIGTKCLAVFLEAQSVTPFAGEAGNYSVTLRRAAGGEDAVGVMVNLFNGTANGGVSNFGITLNPLDTKTQKIVGVPGVNKMEYTAFFTDDAGNPQTCSQTNEWP